MTTAMTKPAANGVAALAQLRQGLAQVRATIPQSVGGQPLLRLLKDGMWVMGSEDTTVATGTEAMINPMSFCSGYTCWTNRPAGAGKNELMGEEMWGITTPKPPASSLPVHHDPRTQVLCAWKDAMSVDMVLMSKPHAGTQVLYKVTSVGGLRVMQALLDRMLEKLDTGSDYCCPIVTIASDSYNHNSYGRTYVPMLEIVGWATMDGVEEDGDDDGVVAVDKAIAKPAPAPAPEPEPEVPAAPAGRRRRI